MDGQMYRCQYCFETDGYPEICNHLEICKQKEQSMNLDVTILPIYHVYDACVYTDEYVSNTLFHFKHPYPVSPDYDPFNMSTLFTNYITDIYFNEAYPMNFSSSFKHVNGHYIWIKENEWTCYTKRTGIDICIEHMKQQFKYFMYFFIQHSMTQTFIQSFEVKQEGPSYNMFIMECKQFFSNSNVHYRSIHSRIKYLYDHIEFVLRCRLNTMYSIMKPFVTADRKQQLTSNFQYMNDLQTMKEELEQTYSNLFA
jgi:hypothetical protein